MAQADKVVAIGETGLDYYRLEGDLEWQRERFRTHIRAAREADKPLVIHTRAAAADTLAIMREERAGEVGGVMHCFTETWDVAQAALDLGFHISFSGHRHVQERGRLEGGGAARAARPHADRDRQSLSRAGAVTAASATSRRGCAMSAKRSPQLREVPVDAIARATSDNFFHLFRIARDAHAPTH